MKITKVKISGFHNVIHKEYDLGDITYFTGHNGAGKSTILNAIEYALFGYIPGTSKNSNESLFKHANRDTMSVELEISDGIATIVVSRSIVKSGSKYLTAFNINPETYEISDIIDDLELPVFNFSEFIGMTANKLKDWFINFLPSSDFTTDWKTVLKDNAGVASILDTYLIPNTLEAIESFNLSGLDEVRKTNEYIKSAISFKKQEIQRLQNTTQSLVYYDDFDCDCSIQELQETLTTYQKYKSMLQEYTKYSEHNAQLDARLAALDTTIDTQVLRNEIDSERNTFNRISEEIIKLNSTISSLNADINSKSNIIKGNGICPYTSKQCNDISRLVADYRNQVINDTAKLSELKKQLTQLNSELSVSTNKINTGEEQFRRAMKQQAEAESLKSAYVELPDISNVPDIEEVEQTLVETQDKIVKLTANEKYQNMIDTLSQQKNVLSQSLDILKKWDTLTGVNGLQATSGTDPFEAFAKSVESYLPNVFGDNCKVHFNSQGKANTFNFGLMRGNTYIPFDLLSSGEKCIYTVALLIALIKQSKSNLKILLIDDLFDHLDTNNISELLDKLKDEKEVQMIFAGVSLPKPLPHPAAIKEIEVCDS